MKEPRRDCVSNIKLNLGWKLSPILFILDCPVALIVSLQWCAPPGEVNVYQGVVEIVPNVSGIALDAQAKGLEPIKRGASGASCSRSILSPARPNDVSENSVMLVGQLFAKSTSSISFDF